MSEFHEALGRVLLDARYMAGGTPAPRDYAFAAMWYVHGHIDHASYGYLAALGVAPRDWRVALEIDSGICGAQAEAMVAIVSAFGCRARYAELAYGDQHHAVTEVEWNDAPHLFDPTWKAWYERAGEILALEAVLADPDPRGLLVWDGRVSGTSYLRNGADPFAYLAPGTAATYREWRP